jgi:hypothetical protein
MRAPHVVVLFQSRLFGEAIAKALSQSGQVTVTTCAVDALSLEMLKEIKPDAIVLEDTTRPDRMKTCLLDVAPVLTVVVGPEINTAEVYERHEVIQATAADIITRITNANAPARYAKQAGASEPPQARR